MALSEKTDEEIRELLTQYDIKHGPIVESTRHLYEKKLEEAMESAAVNTSSDKTYYREEGETVTIQSETLETKTLLLRWRGNANTEEAEGEEEQEEEEEAEEEEEEEEEEESEPAVQVTHRTANHSAVRSKKVSSKSGGCMGKFFRLLLLLAVLAGAYYAYSQMVNTEEEPAGPE
ncbi:emerin (Emery-Dreifuss muscular dystrophy) [Xyrichtys novacula]|uniref:Emerin (Emery-Dreifuss muscular dystrophy) n=1 Tax=Xyrichtys novacula TaxID=13765 RepID=A0AAV1F2W4_XYRNO|nr:emerin (Emery-Dreifuss muscular dystrophy) [Xyrichtys novacula]